MGSFSDVWSKNLKEVILTNFEVLCYKIILLQCKLKFLSIQNMKVLTFF